MDKDFDLMVVLDKKSKWLQEGGKVEINVSQKLCNHY